MYNAYKYKIIDYKSYQLIASTPGELQRDFLNLKYFCMFVLQLLLFGSNIYFFVLYYRVQVLLSFTNFKKVNFFFLIHFLEVRTAVNCTYYNEFTKVFIWHNYLRIKQISKTIQDLNVVTVTSFILTTLSIYGSIFVDPSPLLLKEKLLTTLCLIIPSKYTLTSSAYLYTYLYSH